MKRTIASLLAGAVLSLAPAFSQDEKDPKGVIKQRQENQKERIQAGIEDGSLTKGEAAKLKAQQLKIAKEIREQRKDGGGLTAKEKAKITKQQNKASREIKQQRSDKQTRR